MAKIKKSLFICVVLFGIMSYIFLINNNSQINWETYDKSVNQIYTDTSANYNVGALVDTYFMGCSNIEWAVTDHDVLDDDPLKPLRQAFQVYHAKDDFDCYVVLFYAPEAKSNYYMGAFLPNAAIETDEMAVQTFSRLFTTKGMVIEILAASKETNRETFEAMVIFIDELTNTIQKSIS